IKKFVKIKIKKNIPFASGLGGGSSDAAAILKGLNKLWKLKLSKSSLADLGAKLGMDVPFFIYGGTALGEHYGEKITKLPTIKNIKFKIYPGKTPLISQKTQTAYQKLSLKKCGQNLFKTKLLIQGIKTKNKKLIIENLHNDFETVTKVSINHHLSGAGPTSFTVRAL
ncbi:MAG: 4-(cytidine 5'-diphospho)-2-C-methyl-D-erythritol kinase, partial [Candidatus Gracilibacteria bacterium]